MIVLQIGVLLFCCWQATMTKVNDDWYKHPENAVQDLMEEVDPASFDNFISEM